jgi:hypothetical protein
LVASLIAGSALGLGACGSGEPASTSTRAAAGGATCPEQRGSDTNYFTFMNDLDTDVTLVVPRDSWTCEGYSGVSTPGSLDGRVIGHPGPQPRIRMESYDSGAVTRFTMSIQAAGATLATVDVSRFLYPGPMYPWGIRIDGKNTCYRPVVELKDPSGGSAGWLTMTKRCVESADGDVVFHLTKNKPWT